MYITMILLFFMNIIKAQKTYENKVNLALYDGIAVIGYVDKGSYLNFTGPNVNVKFQNSKLILGMLPSLRFRKDNGVPKNAFVTPNLGVGLTYSYKKIVIQVPAYYNAKTAAQDGKWNVGIGVGYRFDANYKVQ